jgi:hypothetical protein
VFVSLCIKPRRQHEPNTSPLWLRRYDTRLNADQNQTVSQMVLSFDTLTLGFPRCERDPKSSLSFSPSSAIQDYNAQNASPAIPAPKIGACVTRAPNPSLGEVDAVNSEESKDAVVVVIPDEVPVEVIRIGLPVAPS